MKTPPVGNHVVSAANERGLSGEPDLPEGRGRTDAGEAETQAGRLFEIAPGFGAGNSQTPGMPDAEQKRRSGGDGMTEENARRHGFTAQSAAISKGTPSIARR